MFEAAFGVKPALKFENVKLVQVQVRFHGALGRTDDAYITAVGNYGKARELSSQHGKNEPGSLSVLESVSGIFVLYCAGGLWGRRDENAILCLYRKAQILASELIRPRSSPVVALPS